jgi:thioredoxin-related protein
VLKKEKISDIGIQLLIQEEADRNFIKDYRIDTTPRFILIDTEGEIVEANAPSPSNPELIKLFKEQGL